MNHIIAMIFMCKRKKLFGFDILENFSCINKNIRASQYNLFIV